MLEEKSIPSKEQFNFARPLTQKLLKQEFALDNELLALMFKDSIEIFRVDSDFQKISTIDKTHFGLNVLLLDFVWSPDCQMLCYSTSKPKVFCQSISDVQNEKRLISCFNDARKNVSKLRWFDTPYKIQNHFDCLRAFESTEKAKTEPSYNLLEGFLKCSHSHIFAMKEILLKIQNLESLITRGGNISVLAGIDEDWTLRLSFGGILDFLRISLSDLVPGIEQGKEVKYEMSADLSHAYFLILKDKESANLRSAKIAELAVLDLSLISRNLQENFLACFAMQSMKETLTNARIGYYSSKSAINEIRTKLHNFFGETDLSDPAILEQLMETIKWQAKTDTFQKFFENVDFKKLFDLSELINNSFSILIDFYLESFYPALQRVSAYLNDIFGLFDYFKAHEFACFSESALNEARSFLSGLLKAVPKLIDSIIAKKLQLKNFCLFCFKWKLKASPNSKNNESPEFKIYSDAVLDFELLLKYLESKNSIFLDDLILSCEDFVFNNNGEEIQVDPFANDKDFEIELQILEKEIGISLPKKNESNLPNTNKGVKELLRLTENALNSLSDNFYKVLSGKVSASNKIELFKQVGQDAEVHIGKKQDGSVLIYLMHSDLISIFTLAENKISIRKSAKLSFINPSVPKLSLFNSISENCAILQNSKKKQGFVLSYVNFEKIFKSVLKEIWLGDKSKLVDSLSQSDVPLVIEAADHQLILELREISDFKANFKQLTSIYSEGKLLILK